MQIYKHEHNGLVNIHFEGSIPQEAIKMTSKHYYKDGYIHAVFQASLSGDGELFTIIGLNDLKIEKTLKDSKKHKNLSPHYRKKYGDDFCHSKMEEVSDELRVRITLTN